MGVKFLDLYKQYLVLQQEINEALQNIITSSAFIGGEEVKKFEESFASFISKDMYALGVANGTDALEIALEALHLPQNSEVLIPANTFAATAEAVVRNGLRIVFVDCGADYTLDIDDIESKINHNTAAIIAVHLYGQPAAMDKIMGIAQEHSLKVIEDCAQAHGAEFEGKRVGGFGDIATFSFYPGKNLGAYGDAGAIVSSNKMLIEQCKQIAHHGGLKKYEHHIIGRNSRLDAMQAAILNVKLPYLQQWNKRRNEVAKMYYKGFKDSALILPALKKQCLSVWHLFVIRCKKRDLLRDFLAQHGIETGLHYPFALPQCPAYYDKIYVRYTHTPHALAWQDELLSLPMGEHLSDEEVQEVIQKVCAWKG